MVIKNELSSSKKIAVTLPNFTNMYLLALLMYSYN
jgi:hypothetical protein